MESSASKEKSRRAIPNANIRLPGCKELCKDMDDPGCKGSITSKGKPDRVRPYTDKIEPRQAKLLEGNIESICTRSKADVILPGQATPKISVELPG